MAEDVPIGFSRAEDVPVGFSREEDVPVGFSRAEDVPVGFPNVDAATDPGYYVRFLEARANQPGFGGMMREYLAILDLRPGLSVLDVGCGIGTYTGWIAAMGAVVTGVDASARMIEAAQQRSPSIDFRVGSATDLPFPDASFDRCLATALLAHLDDPDAAIAEMVRVLRPGGRLMIMDLDAESRVIDHPDRDTTCTVLRRWADSYRHGTIGRELPRRLRAAGLTVDATRWHTYAFATNAPGEAGWITPALDRAVAAGTYFSTMTTYAVAGVKPS